MVSISVLVKEWQQMHDKGSIVAHRPFKQFSPFSEAMLATPIELDYLTGSNNRANLTELDYQEQTAGAIAQGILQFVQQLVE